MRERASEGIRALAFWPVGFIVPIAWLGAGKGREGKVVPGQTASMENGIYIASSRINEGSLPYCMEA